MEIHSARRIFEVFTEILVTCQAPPGKEGFLLIFKTYMVMTACVTKLWRTNLRKGLLLFDKSVRNSVLLETAILLSPL